MTAPGMLAVHAHADDESITMGGTFAVLADRGIRTANVTCTDGQLATIYDPTMDEAEARPRLGEIRREELRAAAAILGIGDVRFLGYHDSGMQGEPSNREPHAFFQQDLGSVVGRLVEVIRDFRPDVVVTYDANGAYGHPDHVQAHRATLLAVEAARLKVLYPEAGEPWTVRKVYYTVMPRSFLRKAVDFARQAGLPSPFGDVDVDDLSFVADDERVTTRIDCAAGTRRKREALRAHRSQIPDDFPLLALPEEVAAEHFSEECYELVLSRVPTSLPETDLFAGIPEASAVALR